MTEPPKGRSYRTAAYRPTACDHSAAAVTSLQVPRQSATNKPAEPGTREPPARAPQMRSFVSYFRGGKPDIEKLRTGPVPLPNTARELKSVAAALGASTSEIKLGANEAGGEIVTAAELQGGGNESPS